MALSGSLNTSDYNGRYYQVSWTAKQSIDKNQSTVSWTLKSIGGSANWYAERTLKVTLGGSSVYSKTARVERYAETIATGTKTITHDSSGAAKFTIKIEAAVYGSDVNCTGSKEFTLDTIARKSTLSVANGTLGTAQTLSVTRQSTSFTHTITYTCGSTSGTIATKSSSTSISFTPPLTLAAQNASGTSVSITYKIETFNGSTSLGSNSYTKTCTIPTSVVPTVSFTVSDANGYSGTYGGYVQGKSALNIAITASGSQGSTIKSYKTTVDGKTYTTASVETPEISGNGTMTITVTVTDSRGRTATSSQNITVLAYEPPKISAFKSERCDSTGKASNSGAYLKITFSATITSLNSKNSATYVLQYKKSTATSYSSATLSSYSGVYTVTNGTYILSADTGSSYDFILKATDKFSTTQITGNGSSIKRLWSWLKNNLGVAFGKVAEKEGLEVDWDAYFNKNLYIGETNVKAELDALKTKMYGVLGAETLEASITKGANYSSAEGSVARVGNVLRVYVNAVRSSNLTVGDITNEVIATVTINHKGKIKEMYNTTGGSYNSGAVNSYYTSNIIKNGTTLSFDVSCGAATLASTKLSTMINVPLVLDLDAF